MTGVTRTWAALLTCGPLLALAAHAEASQAKDFREVLRTAEIGPAAFDLFASHDGRWSDAQHGVAVELLDLLARFQSTELDNWTSDPSDAPESVAQPQAGQLMWFAGPAVRRMASDRFERILMHDAQDEPLAVVATPHAPQYWSNWAGGELPQTPIRVRGIVLGTATLQDRSLPFVLTDWVQWRPTGDAPTGWLELARAGMDISLLDEVKHRQPFVPSTISREGEAFYEMLSAAAGINLESLVRLAADEIARRTPQWQRAADEAEAALRALSPAPQRSEQEQAQAKTLQRRRAIALAAIDRHAQGLSSVAPLFLLPELETGRLVYIEGVARRAVAINVASEHAPARSPASAATYYEVEVFTADSENLPVVCCVAELPPQFPTGDAIREPVSVAGFFFKQWVYRSRQAGEAAKSPRRRGAQAPVVIGPSLLWTPATTRREPTSWGMWAGFGVLGALGVVWFGLWRLAVRDRAARERNFHRTQDG